MKRALVFYPVNVVADQPDEALAEFIHAWGQLHPEHPLIIAAQPHSAQVYLVVGSSADLADEVFADGRVSAKPWPDLPVMWAEGGPAFYGSISGFMSQISLTLEDLLRGVYGTLSRQTLVDQYWKTSGARSMTLRRSWMPVKVKRTRISLNSKTCARCSKNFKVVLTSLRSSEAAHERS